MSEQIYTYSLDNKNEVFPQDRDKFYKKQIEDFHKNGVTSEAVEVIHVLLFNTDGELLVQKRGKNKAHNAGLLDKSLGGHMKFGDTPDFTTMVETVEELQIPSIVLHNILDFEKSRKLLKNYRQNIAVIKPFKSDFFDLSKIIDGEKIPIVNKANIYFGVYNGTTRPADREASGVLYYSLDDLVAEIGTSPEQFTGDLRFLLKTFEKDLREFVKHVKE